MKVNIIGPVVSDRYKDCFVASCQFHWSVGITESRDFRIEGEADVLDFMKLWDACENKPAPAGGYLALKECTDMIQTGYWDDLEDLFPFVPRVVTRVVPNEEWAMPTSVSLVYYDLAGQAFKVEIERDQDTDTDPVL